MGCRGGAAAAFVLIWAWVAAMPIAFLDPEYAFWQAKQAMLRNCDLGEVLVLGDSRAAAGIRVTDLPVRATNLAVGGGKPVEAFAALNRALACPRLPQRVVLSFDAIHFSRSDLFWERAVRFGFLDAEDLSQLRGTARASGDHSLYDQQRFSGLPQLMRDWLYLARFPGLYVGSLLQGGFLMRLPGNQVALAQGMASRGQYYFGTAEGSGVVTVEGHMPGFTAAPVLDRYFDRILATLERRGIPVDFVPMPINSETARVVAPALRAGFRAYLGRYEARYPGFHVLGVTMPAWPDRLFGDMFSHLNPRGAAFFTAELGECLAVRLRDSATSCRFEWPPGGRHAQAVSADDWDPPISVRGNDDRARFQSVAIRVEDERAAGMAMAGRLDSDQGTASSLSSESSGGADQPAGLRMAAGRADHVITAPSARSTHVARNTGRIPNCPPMKPPTSGPTTWPTYCDDVE